MAQRKTLEAQIEAAREELRQRENRLNELMHKQKVAERKELFRNKLMVYCAGFFLSGARLQVR